ncbi:copper homeostasis protein CutC [Segetibacter koreensis]|uniref:copper homeostasis protein CutC n=1 Tax=Segetibacter koreensis TaxID=398037 RepID=UPI00037D0CE9|nr:copper homeostasis protein CutC [Segetibacter koreensis]
MNYILEIAVNDYLSAASAIKGGADRIELCSALSEGGVTTSHGVIKKCQEDFTIPISPIIRPRAGDFLYSEEEFDIIQKDVLFCRQAGCAGIVTGFLLPDGNIDIERTSIITTIAYPMEVTFHRAFDRCRNPFSAMEDIISAGCNRILTSAQKTKAPEGTELIKQLIEAAKGRIIIMPGSGVRKENIRDLAEKTGATEFHSSVKSLSKSKMEFIHPTFAEMEGEYLQATVDSNDVKALREALPGAGR